MSDDRPRPEYGEYATPEQQAAAMGRVYIPPEQVAAQDAAAEHAMSQTTFAPPTGYANRFFTVFLLGLGAVTLVETIPSYFNYGSLFKGQVALALGSISIPASINGAGIPTLVANVVLYGATVLLSVLALRRGRISFYIPIAGAILFGLVALILLDLYAPGFFSELQDLTPKTTG